MKGAQNLSLPGSTRARGAAAEAAGVCWLEDRGYQILARNVRTRAGELDVVAAAGEVLCFVEIKARWTADCGLSVAAVTPRKQARLRRAAALYLARNPHAGACRFDVLGLDATEDGGWRFTLVENAF